MSGKKRESRLGKEYENAGQSRDPKRGAALCPVCRAAMPTPGHVGSSLAATLREHLISAGDACLINVHAALLAGDKTQAPKSSDMSSRDKRQRTFHSNPAVLRMEGSALCWASLLAEAGFVLLEEGRGGRLRCFHCHLVLEVSELRCSAGDSQLTLEDLLGVHLQRSQYGCVFALEMFIRVRLRQHADRTGCRDLSEVDIFCWSLLKVGSPESVTNSDHLSAFLSSSVGNEDHRVTGSSCDSADNPDVDFVLNLPAVQSVKYVFPAVTDTMFIHIVNEYHQRSDARGSWPNAQELYAMLEQTFPSATSDAVCFWDPVDPVPGTDPSTVSVYSGLESATTTEVLSSAAAGDHVTTPLTTAPTLLSKPQVLGASGGSGHLTNQPAVSSQLPKAEAQSYYLLLRKNCALKLARLCYRCKSNPRTTTLLPCGHFLFCESCGRDMTHCDACNILVIGDVRTYLS